MAIRVQDGFVVPPDVDYYTPVAANYASGTNNGVVGDGSTPRGGTMPIIANQLDDIPSVAPEWIVGSPSFDPVTNLNAEETKFRTVGFFDHINRSDPIRNWGQPGTSHWHTYFGSTSTNAFSTYHSLRTRANLLHSAAKPISTIGGGPLNATGYWAPTIIDGDGNAVIMDQAIVYYTANPATRATVTSRIPRGLRYISGCNMDDPFDTIIKAEIEAANAQAGTAGRYSYRGNGFQGWSAHPPGDRGTVVPSVTGNYHFALQTLDGQDPWEGNAESGGWLVAHFNAPEVYDGVNLWSPGGYKHLRQTWNDTQSAGKAFWGFPDGWYRLPPLIVTLWFRHAGPSDYMTWFASSDAMFSANAKIIDPEVRDLAPGESMHLDWQNGWDDETFLTWQDAAFGVDGNTSLVALDYSTISTTERMAGGDMNALNQRGQLRPIVAQPGLQRVKLPNFDAPFDIYSATGPAPVNMKLWADGDSITAHGASPPNKFATNNPTVDLTEAAVGGVGLTGTNSPASRKDAVIAAKPRAYYILIGANDLNSFTTGEEYFEEMRSVLTDDIRLAGIPVYVGYILPQSNGTSTSFNTKRAEFNAAALAAVGTFIDGVVTWADTGMEEDTDAADTGKYSDGLHPTDGTAVPANNGYALLYPSFEAVFDEVFGF